MPKKTSIHPKERPTPMLGRPTRDKQIFTYSENKLLDQITIEIMEAWRNDLIVIRKHHKEILECQVDATLLSDLLRREFPKLEKFLTDNDYINQFSTLTKEVEIINSRHGIISKTLFDLEQKLDFDYIKKMMESIKIISKDIEKIKNTQNKKWWQNIFKSSN